MRDMIPAPALPSSEERIPALRLDRAGQDTAGQMGAVMAGGGADQLKRSIM
jgi:hypothetical protein